MIPLRILYRATPVWLRWTLLGAVLWTASMVAAVQYGRSAMRTEIEAAAAAARNIHIRNGVETHDEIQNLDDDGLLDRLRGVLGSAD